MSSLLFVFQLFNQIFNHLLFVFKVEPPQGKHLNGSRGVAVCGELVARHQLKHLALSVQRLAIEAEVTRRRDNNGGLPTAVTKTLHLLVRQPVVNSLETVNLVVGLERQFCSSQFVIELQHGLELTRLLRFLLHHSEQVGGHFKRNLLGLAHFKDL